MAAAAAATTAAIAGPACGYASPSPASGGARLAFLHRHGASSVCGGTRTLALEAVTRRRSRSSRQQVATARAAAAEGGATSGRIIHGKCFVVGDNIDTDQIIPAEHLTLVPSKPEEYEKLGSYAMSGLPPTAGYGTFIEPGSSKAEYKVMIGGANFGCGSSREHAPVALGAAGVRAVVAQSYARIFFRNSVATGELYPVESHDRICEQFKTGEIVTVDLERDVLVNHTTGNTYSLQPIGDAGPVIDAGGLFEYARKTGMIATVAP